MTSCDITDYICITQRCSGNPTVDQPIFGQELFTVWDTYNCPNAYAGFINTDENNQYIYSPASMQIMQSYVVNLFNNYFITNSLTDDINSNQYNPFQNQLLDLCLDNRLPGICQQFLTSYCDQYSRNQVINSEVLTNFCGCYTPPDPTYLEITNNPACDPLCHRSLTSHQADINTGEILDCPQNICVINDVNITVDNSRIPGGINFNNVCAGCTGTENGCLCIVSGSNISDTTGAIGITTNFNQFCGSNSICIVQDANGNVLSQGACDDISDANMTVTAAAWLPKLGVFIVVVIIIVIVLLICLYK